MSFEKKKKRRKGTAGIAPQPYSNERWEIEKDLESIARADAVRTDPDRMAKVKKLAAEKLDESKRKKEEAQKMIELGQEA